MTVDELMKWNDSMKSLFLQKDVCSGDGFQKKLFCFLFLYLLLCPLVPLVAQDRIPDLPSPQPLLADADTLLSPGQRTDTLSLPPLLLPTAFRGLQENCLDDPSGALHPFWEKLRLLRLGLSTDTVRVVHVGDSHIRGHIFPRTAGQLMQQVFGPLAHTDMGINGAFCFTFARPDRVDAIAALRPDLLILSFGTNESHNRRYDPQLHRRQMDELVRLLRQSLPGVPMLVTTPPGSYESLRQRGRRRTYKINLRTAAAVQVIRSSADANGLALWDLYHILGGPSRACLNWQEAGLLRPDHVHYMPDGYRLQGELLFQALLKDYNDYVQH